MKITNFLENQCIDYRVIFDEYIPFKVVFSSEDPLTDNYFRLGDGENLLMELCFHKNTRRINSFTIISIGNCIIKDTTISISDFNYVSGIPLFDNDNLFEDESFIVDEFSNDAVIYFMKNSIGVSLPGSSEYLSYILCGNLIFATNDSGTIVNIMILFDNKKESKKILNFCKNVFRCNREVIEDSHQISVEKHR